MEAAEDTQGEPSGHTASTVATCKCGRSVLARGMCSTCYSRARSAEIKAGRWVGQHAAPSGPPSDYARAALASLRIYHASMGFWPSGEQLLRLAHGREAKADLARGLRELVACGLIAYQLVPVGLARRVVRPSKQGRSVSFSPQSEARNGPISR